MSHLINTIDMAPSLNFSCFLLLVPILLIPTLIQARPRPKHHLLHKRLGPREFIWSQCQTTMYSSLCIRYLSSYFNHFTTTPSHQQLAQIALKVSLARAESTRAYVTHVAKKLAQAKAKDYWAVKECLDQINDGIEQLTNSIKEIQKIKKDDGSRRGNFNWHASNVQTWMSAAVTDASTCLDGFPGRAKPKAMIKAKVLNLQQATSNALALFNRFAARYMSSHDKKPGFL